MNNLQDAFIRSDGIVADDLNAGLAAAIGSSGDWRGYCKVDSEESRTNTAYGTLTTPDQVTAVPVPAGALVYVTYVADAKESVGAAASVRLVTTNSRSSTVLALETTTALGALVNTYYGYVTGVDDSVSWPGLVSRASQPSATSWLQPLAIPLYLAADTYTFAVQYKASSGTVTAKNRKLWVEVRAF